MKQITGKRKTEKTVVVLEAIIIMVVLQLLKMMLEAWLCPLFDDTLFHRRMTTMVTMMLLSVVVFCYAKKRRVAFAIFPVPFNRAYLFATVLFVILFVTTPSNFTEGYQAVCLLFYGSVVTPIYEELLFRGYFWNRFSFVFEKESTVYFWNVALFTLWHLGYVITPLLNGNYTAVMGKLLAGLCYGLVLGAVRKKTKNCYSTMLLHGIINIFMI